MKRDIWIDCYAPLVGRIFVGGCFLLNGIQAALNFTATADSFSSHGFAAAPYWAAGAIGVQVVLGLVVVVGLWTRISALLLALYLLLRMAFLTDFTSDLELNILLLNIGLVGGLLYISAYGAGSLTLGTLKRH